MIELGASDGTLDQAKILTASVGNTTTAFAVFEGLKANEPSIVGNDDPVEIAKRISDEAKRADAVVVLASVNREVSDLVTARIEGAAVTVFQIGKDVPVPIERALDENTKPGDDRLLVALAAYEGLQQACVVVDAGTAVTVDFVDGEGTFQGGAIAPGLRMMLGALHEGTDALPALELVGKLPKEPFGKRTGDAMQLGCIASVQGLVRHLAERYAVAYDAYPLIVATGGDAELLFGNDELIDRIVPDLALRGIAIACQKALASQADNG